MLTRSDSFASLGLLGNPTWVLTVKNAAWRVTCRMFSRYLWISACPKGFDRIDFATIGYRIGLTPKQPTNYLHLLLSLFFRSGAEPRWKSPQSQHTALHQSPLAKYSVCQGKSYTCENALFNEKREEVKYVLHATRLSGIEESSLLRWIPFEVIAKVYCFIVPRVEEGVKSLCSPTLVLCCCGLVSLYLYFLYAQNWIH